MSKLILHLDDEAPIREILSEMLTAQGYRVVSVTTPGEALNAAKAERPDLLISDLQLEEGDGLETIEQLRSLHSGMPVVILTGVLVDPRVAGLTFARSASAYLPKTTPLLKIVEEIRRLIGG